MYAIDTDQWYFNIEDDENVKQHEESRLDIDEGEPVVKH